MVQEGKVECSGTSRYLEREWSKVSICIADMPENANPYQRLSRICRFRQPLRLQGPLHRRFRRQENPSCRSIRHHGKGTAATRVRWIAGDAETRYLWSDCTRDYGTHILDDFPYALSSEVLITRTIDHFQRSARSERLHDLSFQLHRRSSTRSLESLSDFTDANCLAAKQEDGYQH